MLRRLALLSIMISYPVVCFAAVSRSDVVNSYLEYYSTSVPQQAHAASEKAAREEAHVKKINDFLNHFNSELSLEERYDDNIFRTHNKSADFITVITPAITYETTSGNGLDWMALEAGSRFKGYAHHSKFNVADPYAWASLNKQIGKIDIGLSGAGEQLQAIGSDLDSLSQDKVFIDYVRTAGQVNVGADLNRLYEEVSYEYAGYSFEEPYEESGDYRRHDVALVNNINVSPKTKVLAEYDHGWVRYRGSRSDNEYDRYLLGVRGKLSDKVNGIAKAGYERRFFDQEDIKSRATPYAKIDLGYDASERIRWELGLGRGFNVPTQTSEDTVKSTDGSLGCFFVPTSSKRLLFAAKVFYSYKEYSSERTDQICDVLLKGQYQFKKWLAFELAYMFRDLGSSSDAIEYTNNTTSLKLRVDF